MTAPETPPADLERRAAVIGNDDNTPVRAREIIEDLHKALQSQATALREAEAALAKIGLKLSCAGQDAVPPHIAETNRNLAYHTAVTTLTNIRKITGGGDE